MKTSRFATVTAAALAISAGLAANVAQAQVVITSDTTIAPNDPTYQNQAVIVRGCTVTINGAQSFQSLTIQRNDANVPGVVTHAPTFSQGGVNGMSISLLGDLFVQGPAAGGLVASKIDVSAKGFPKGEGPGAADDTGGHSSPTGGSYAGEGGIGEFLSTGGGFIQWYSSFLPAACYGSITHPSDFGSGSGVYQPLSGPFVGAAGGGCVRIDAQGIIHVYGNIIANGESSVAGGAGGSIYLTANDILGTGVIQARGGNAVGGGGGGAGGGGGGGGRVSMIAPRPTFMGATSAAGGSTPAPTGPTSAGGAGTIYIETPIGQPQLIIDNGLAGANHAFGATQLTGELTTRANVYLLNNARVGPQRGDTTPLHWTIDGSLTVDASSVVTASARGARPAPEGNGGGGAGFFFEHTPGGGGHGGAGGAGADPIPPSIGTPGASHGDADAPTSFGGSGGASGFYASGFGGGAIRLTVSGNVALQGVIASDGAGRSSDDLPFAAGCAGGSVWIETPSITGGGSILARGGNAGSGTGGGGGGGGRIRIDSCGLGIASANISVAGGAPTGPAGAHSGEPGTIVTAAGATDWNHDGVVNSTDVSDFINDWFTDQAKGSTLTDFNHDGVSNSTDVSDFINAWFAEQSAC